MAEKIKQTIGNFKVRHMPARAGVVSSLSACVAPPQRVRAIAQLNS